MVLGQDELDFGALLATSFDPLLALASEAALLENADRGDVVVGHVGVKGTHGHDTEKPGQSLRRDTPAPMLFADPVADEADIILLPTPDVSGHFAIEEDRLRHRRRVAEDVVRPMRIEGGSIALGEARHSRRISVELLLEEDGEVVRLDVAESNLVAHISIFGCEADRVASHLTARRSAARTAREEV